MTGVSVSRQRRMRLAGAVLGEENSRSRSSMDLERSRCAKESVYTCEHACALACRHGTWSRQPRLQYEHVLVCGTRSSSETTRAWNLLAAPQPPSHSRTPSITQSSSHSHMKSCGSPCGLTPRRPSCAVWNCSTSRLANDWPDTPHIATVGPIFVKRTSTAGLPW